MLRLHESPLSEDEVLRVRREIAAEVLADLAREWGDEEPPTVAELLRRLLREED